MKRIPKLLAISELREVAARAELKSTKRASDLELRLRQLVAAGVDGIQLREKDLDDRELWSLAQMVSRTGQGLITLVNGRADIAIAAGLDGVHLPSSGVPVEALRRRFGAEMLIGCSTHHVEEVEQARIDGADYVTFGPIFPTPSKEAYGKPPGLEALRRAVRCGLPVIALGGIGPAQVAAVAAAGAAGVAGIRAFQTAEAMGQMVAASTILETAPKPMTARRD